MRLLPTEAKLLRWLGIQTRRRLQRRCWNAVLKSLWSSRGRPVHTCTVLAAQRYISPPTAARWYGPSARGTYLPPSSQLNGQYIAPALLPQQSLLRVPSRNTRKLWDCLQPQFKNCQRLSAHQRPQLPGRYIWPARSSILDNGGLWTRRDVA
ncbi:nucleoside 2-deoxyribosyltransferase family protein [Burkholderia pseudomallei]|nr:nucleoside 2-deoxyribosyltransferase family protein [Burkholderia pseudomallei]